MGETIGSILLTHDLYSDAIDAMYDRVDIAIAEAQSGKSGFVDRLQNGEQRNLVIYSAYDTEYDAEADEDLPVDNLDEIPHKGTFILRYDTHWGDNVYESKPVTDPTWMELTILANEAICYSGDEHHVFFEGVNKNGNVLEIATGS